MGQIVLTDKETMHAYKSGGKRILDLCASAIGLVLLLPVFLVIVVVSKLSSAGPVFYRQERIGKAVRSFKIVKFRTMYVDADRDGPSITVGGDPRIEDHVGEVPERLEALPSEGRRHEGHGPGGC